MNENGNLILKNEEIAKTFNDYFGAIVDNLNLHHWEDKTSSPSNTSHKINDIFFFFDICNLHFFKQKTCSHQVLMYLNVPGIPVRKPLQNRQIVEEQLDM